MRYIIPIFLVLTTPAFAECMELTKAKENIAAKHGQWIDLTDGQWEFMRGVFWIHPKTPSRLPRGDRAAMATSPDHDDRMIFFIDGELACDMLILPPEGLATLMDVGSGVTTHEEKGP